MKDKKVFYTELNYVFGILILALGTALMERANFGLSMVVAPAYLIHRKVSEILPWFTFGVAEYCLQAVILMLMSILARKVKLRYLLSFITAVFYGLVLDMWIWVVGFITFDGIIARFIFFIIGELACSFAISLLFHTYITPEAYELFVKEFSEIYKTNINKTKMVYDISSLIISVVLSFIFFGLWHFEGISYGTVICALVNGVLIGTISKWLESKFEFKDGLKLRSIYEK